MNVKFSMDPLDRIHTIPKGDWFDEQVLLNFLKRKSTRDFFNEPKFKVSSEQISSRVIKHWDDNGLLNDDRPEGKGWRKFSFTEITWIKIISKLRSFGFQLPNIKVVKECLSVHSQDKHKMPLLEYYLGIALTKSTPVFLIVFSNGEADLVLQNELETAQQFGFIDDDYIKIDLTRLLKKVKKNKTETKYIENESTAIEKEIYHAVNIEEISSITIQVKEKEFIIKKEFITNHKEGLKPIIQQMKFGEQTKVMTNGKAYYRIIDSKKIDR